MRIIPKARDVKEMSIAEPQNSFDISVEEAGSEFHKKKGLQG